MILVGLGLFLERGIYPRLLEVQTRLIQQTMISNTSIIRLSQESDTQWNSLGVTWFFDPQSGNAIHGDSEVKDYVSRFAGVGSNSKHPNWPGGAIQVMPISDMNIYPIIVETILQIATT